MNIVTTVPRIPLLEVSVPNRSVSARGWLVAASVVLIAAATVSGCSRAKSTDTAPSPSGSYAPSGTQAVQTTAATGGSAGTSLAPNAGAVGGSASTVGGSAASGNSAAGPTGGSGKSSSSGGGKSSAGVSAKKSATGMQVRILWFNDTAGKPVKAPKVVVGASVYSPPATGKTGQGSVGPVPYGAAAKLVVYPDGPSGHAIAVPLQVTADMVPNSDRDGIRVAVSDKTVRVVGNAVVGFDQTYAR